MDHWTDILLAELRAFRARRDMTQSDLALKAGMTPATLARRITTPGDFTINEIRLLAHALNLTMQLSLDGITVIDLHPRPVVGANK